MVLKKQPTMSKSSTDVEYRVVAHTVQDTLWIHKLLPGLGIALRTPIRVMCDNVSVLYTCT